MGNAALLIAVGIIMFSFFGIITIISHIYNLNSIKSKTVGDGQHGSARFASKGEYEKHTDILNILLIYGEKKLQI